MEGIKLMNRIDTKYVTTCDMLKKVLCDAKEDYYVQEIDGMRIMPYATLYYDTDIAEMYVAHQNGIKTRQKIRIRSYIHSGTSFLEVKRKNNRGRTRKRRIEIASKNDVKNDVCRKFIDKESKYSFSKLSAQIENNFNRITLVNRQKTERLTIDFGLKFYNLVTASNYILENLVIIELKRNGNLFSPIKNILREHRIRPSGFSKYCIGMALTNDALKRNCIKERLNYVKRLNTQK